MIYGEQKENEVSLSEFCLGNVDPTSLNITLVRRTTATASEDVNRPILSTALSYGATTSCCIPIAFCFAYYSSTAARAQAARRATRSGSSSRWY